MDGNGRWAKARGLPRTAGHYQGAETVRQVVEASIRNDITHLTLFGFSSENWKRPATEINDLMGLLRLYLRREIARLHDNGVRLSVIGERHRLAPDIVELIEGAERQTRDNSRLRLTIALSYGGRMDIVNAARQLAQRVAQGELRAEDIDEAMFAGNLSTADMPDPDLVIRTSGEMRISNFLLWQFAYTEMIFVDKHWPEFSAADFSAALAEYQGRNRRYGAAG
ncbi:polyprenyl diphosphate synthase [Dongia soli]|uniref:Isoprenyl transferase n=1 Tax=Dongia soli TaxID=600628 RepID=A0ABU5E9M2_9PROT|nr:polyprenyl diphosphate synthase [Dongia soli]MDY0883033.1 polyprenyl diphosphate synthase [Dongia soli]